MERSFEELADHLEEFNGYYGTWYDYGLLHIPTMVPCKTQEPCKLCKKISIDDKTKWEFQARHINKMNYQRALRYHDVCLKQ